MNPLLEPHVLPPFKHIKAEHVVPAIETLLESNRAAMQALIEQEKPYTWDNFVEPMMALQAKLERAWSPVTHLHGVADSDALRTAYNTCLPLLSAYSSEIGQNKDLYAAYHAVKEAPDFAQLDVGQQTIVNNELRDFHLSGVDLPAEQQQRVKDIHQQLSKLGTQFSENLLDATNSKDAWKKHLSDETLLAGLPDTVKDLAKQNATQAELEGWLLTLDMPCYLPVMQYADDRELRHEMYVAYFTRASEQGKPEWDNSALMSETLALRHELAQLLGFANYAELSLSRKMAETPQQVVDFLLDLAKHAKPVGEQDLQTLKTFAHEHYGVEQLEMWDVPYYSEKLRLHQYDISQQTLRPYFALPNVLDGLFAIVSKLYGIQFQVRTEVETWHDDVRFYDIIDADGSLRAQFYLDLYARNGKRGGAWMADCRTRQRIAEGMEIPVAYLNCNFTPPVGTQSTLLTHQEVITLYHEFGHGLHHMLSKVDYAAVSGINGVAWDAVELPSQFMENWAWERESLDLFAKHYETGEKLPDTLYKKMYAAKNFQSGLAMLRQLEFALFDFILHKDYQPDIDIQVVLDDVRNTVAVLKPPAFVRFQNQFGHIFAGGYAAGYYSYKWAEVLSADAFSKFEENGIFDSETGQAFLTHILEKGGSEDAMVLYVRFRGREPKIDALLQHAGMAA